MTQAQTEAIEVALDVVGPRLARRLRHVDFLCGVDPSWVGLHQVPAAPDGRLYRDTAHCCFPQHTSDRSTTIVLPVLATPVTVVHELGHALQHEYAPGHAAVPVTDYARTSRWEAFAESFVASFFWYGDQDLWWVDEATRDVIRRLDS